MKQYVKVAAAALFVAACAGNPAPAVSPAATNGNPAGASAPAVDAVAAAAATITPDDMYRRVAFLASDELAGRDTPSPGLDKAADYVAGEFRSFGLSAAGDSGSYIQRWPFRVTRFDPEKTNLRVTAGGSTVTAGVGRDFFLVPAAGRTSATGSLLYAGTAKAGAAPLSANAGAFGIFFLPGLEPDQSWQLGLQAAIGSAAPAGLAGVILVLDPGFDAGMIPQINQETSSQQAPFFLIGLRYETAKQFFAGAGQDLDVLTQTQPADPLTLEGASLAIDVARTTVETRAPNVVGTLVGSDPVLRNEYIIFSAHMDHVGIGSADASGDSIFNGADDDASGTATMLEVAEAFASLPTRPARSLIFLAVSGEEKGLLGSGWFAQHPPVPMDRVVANINLDMVGRNAPDTVVAIGQDYSDLGEIVQRVAQAHPELHLVVAPDLWPEERLFFRSDHFNFAKAGVPALFFTTGLHEQYHKQSDEVDLIDRDKMSRIGRLVFRLAHEVATRADAPKWTEKGIAEVQPAGGK